MLKNDYKDRFMGQVMSILGEKGNRKEKHGEEFAYMSRLGEMIMAENRRELTQDEMDLNTGAEA